MKKILFLLVLIFNFGYSLTITEIAGEQYSINFSSSTGGSWSTTTPTTPHCSSWNPNGNLTYQRMCYSGGQTYAYNAVAGRYGYAGSVLTTTATLKLKSNPNEPNSCSEKSVLGTNSIYLCNASTGDYNEFSNPDPNGGAQCRPLFALNGAAWTCDPNTNSATMVNDSNGVTLDENGNDIPSCNAGLVQKGNTCAPQETADSCPSGSHSFTDVITGQKGCIPDYIPPTTDSGTGTSSGGGSGSGSSSGGSGSSTGGTGTTDSGSGTGSGTSTGGTGTTDSGSGSGTGSGGSSGGSGTSGGGTGTPTDSGTGTPTDSGTGTPTDTPTTPTNTDGNGSCSATGLTLQEKMLCELKQGNDTTNSKLGVANAKLTNIDENMTKLAAQSFELNKNLNNDIFSNNSFNDKLIVEVNKSKSLAKDAETAMNNVGTGYQQMIGNLNTLQSFLQNKEDNSVTLNFVVSPPSCTNYNIFGHSKCLNCFFNIDMASLFVNIKPFITFLLNIVFVVLSIKMFMRHALSSAGVV